MLRAKPLKAWAVMLASVLVLSACGTSTDEESPGSIDEESPGGPTSDLSVVVTTTILGDLVEALVGDAGTVEVLLPVGADPHDFQPSSRDGVKIREADLVVANGLGLEESLISLFEAAREDGVRILEVGELVDPLTWSEEPEEGDHHDEEEGDHHDEEEGEEEGDHHDEEEGHHDEEEGEEEGDHHDEEEGDHDEEEGEEEGDGHGHGHGEGGFDPHFWFDPSRVVTAVRVIAAELIDVGKGWSASEWNERADNYIAQINEAITEAEELLSAVPPLRRKLVTNHDSFRYFGSFFGFEILDTILSGGSTLARPGTAHLAELVEAIRAEGVPAIFAETTADTGIPKTVAAEFDPPLEVVELYTGSLGPEGGDADTYPKWLVANARLIAEAITS